MTEQIWYARSRHGLWRNEGYQPRAASPGLRTLVFRDAFSALERQLQYGLPAQANVVLARQRAAEAPISLALRCLDDKRCLVHKVISDPQDPAGSARTFFTHALWDLPAMFGVPEAIRLWRAPFWERTDASLADDQYDLQVVDAMALAAATQWSLPVTNEIVAAIPAVLGAYLSRSERQRLYLVGAPDLVAGLIMALSLALPDRLLAGVTFSTYEPAQRLPVEDLTIVGTNWWFEHRGARWASDEDALPEACYDSGVVVNLLQPASRQTLSWDDRTNAYGSFVARCLEAGDLGSLANARALAKAAQVEDGERLLRLCHFAFGAATTAELPELLGDQLLCDTLFTGAAASHLVRLLLEAGQPWWDANAPGLALRWTRHPSPQTQQLPRFLASEATTEATRLLTTTGDGARARVLVEHVADALDRSGRSGRARQMFNALSQHATDTWIGQVDDGTRGWLLQRWADDMPHLGVAEIGPWLRVASEEPWQSLAWLQSLDLPPSWRAEIARQALLSNDLPLETELEPLAQALRDLVAVSEGWPDLVRLTQLARHAGDLVLSRWLVLLFVSASLPDELKRAVLEQADLTDQQRRDLVETPLANANRLPRSTTLVGPRDWRVNDRTCDQSDARSDRATTPMLAGALTPSQREARPAPNSQVATMQVPVHQRHMTSQPHRAAIGSLWSRSVDWLHVRLGRRLEPPAAQGTSEARVQIDAMIEDVLDALDLQWRQPQWLDSVEVERALRDYLELLRDNASSLLESQLETLCDLRVFDPLLEDATRNEAACLWEIAAFLHAPTTQVGVLKNAAFQLVSAWPAREQRRAVLDVIAERLAFRGIDLDDLADVLASFGKVDVVLCWDLVAALARTLATGRFNRRASRTLVLLVDTCFRSPALSAERAQPARAQALQELAVAIRGAPPQTCRALARRRESWPPVQLDAWREFELQHRPLQMGCSESSSARAARHVGGR